MTAQQLKNSILQMAVQGKLVEQNPDDEPASVLLERIKAEKQELIKTGKIKKGKPLPEITEDEILFDIPDSWEWVRLSQIGETNIGLTYRPSDKTTFGGTLVLRSSNIQNDKMDYTDNVFVSCDIPERAMIHKGDILICARNGSRALVGKCAIVDKDGMAFGAFMAKFSSQFNPYIKLFIDSPIFRQQLDGVKTETINQITQEMLKNQLCPLPPFAEQQRIVKKIEELLPYIEKYGKAEEQLTALNTTFPEALKKSILQEAVQGKLVPQNPDDEPASVLLERIRAEKQALIKTGKIKKEKPLPEITEDEIPFDIPDSWCWCRLGNILLKLTDGTHSTPKYTESGIPFISVKDVSSGNLDFSNCKHISEKEHFELYERCNPEYGDILLTKVGTTGIPVIVDTTEQFSLFVSVALLKFNQELLYNKYLIHMINSPLVQKQATENTKGVGNKNWVMRDIANTLIVIPPIEEQHRIVAKIEELMPIISTISK